MQHFEPSVHPLATQGDLVKHKRRGQVGQMALHLIGPCGDLCLWQTPRQGQVKPKFFHDIGIAPLHQQCVLPRAQPHCATTRQFRRVRRGPKGIKFTDASLRDPPHILRSAQWCQRQKPAQGRQFRKESQIAGASDAERSDVAASKSLIVSVPFRRNGGFNVPWNPYLRGVIVMSRKPGTSC